MTRFLKVEAANVGQTQYILEVILWNCIHKYNKPNFKHYEIFDTFQVMATKYVVCGRSYKLGTF